MIIFDSGIPGPCLGVTVQAHGNEPSVLAAFHYFRQEQMITNAKLVVVKDAPHQIDFPGYVDAIKNEIELS